MKKQQTRKTTMMSPGRYFVGDPAYAMSQEMWKATVEGVKVDRGLWQGAIDFGDGTTFAFYLAARPRLDVGIYCDADGNQYQTGTGLLGCVPEILWDSAFDAAHEFELSKMGQIVNFQDEFSTGSDAKHGVTGRFVTVGHIVIDTLPGATPTTTTTQ